MRGALPPVDLRAVCLVRAISDSLGFLSEKRLLVSYLLNDASGGENRAVNMGPLASEFKVVWGQGRSNEFLCKFKAVDH